MGSWVWARGGAEEGQGSELESYSLCNGAHLHRTLPCHAMGAHPLPPPHSPSAAAAGVGVEGSEPPVDGPTGAGAGAAPAVDPFALPPGMEQYQSDMERGLATFMDLAEVGYVCTCVLRVYVCVYVCVVCVRVCVVCTYVGVVFVCVVALYIAPPLVLSPRAACHASTPCCQARFPPPLNPCPRTPSVCHTSP